MFRDRALMLQFCRFASVGIVSLLVDYVVMIFLTEFMTWDYFWACGFSYTMSIAVNYVLSMRYVFQGREDTSKVREASVFMLLSLVGLALNQMAMWMLVDVAHIYYAIAKLLATGMVTGYNFISRKTFMES